MSAVHAALENQLTFNTSAYRSISENNFNNRVVQKYVLVDTREETLVLAVEAIRTFLANNPTFCAVFPTEPSDKFKLQVQQKKFLTINGQAVCLAGEREAPARADRTFKDRFFSQALLADPVQCSQGHYLERDHAQYWINVKGNKCPEGDHPIGELRIDEELKNDIDRFKQEEQETQANHERQVVGNLAIQTNLLVQQAQIGALRGTVKTIDRVAIATTFGKIVLKIAAEKGILVLGKVVAKTGASVALKNFAKAIPFVGLVVGAGCAIYRIYKGVKTGDKSEYVKAVAELVSGGVSCIPVAGLIGSIAIDLGIGAHDVYVAYQNVKTHNKSIQQEAEVVISIAKAYTMLGLSDNPLPSKQLVDKAWRDTCLAIHPDNAARYGQEIAQNFDKMQAILNQIRSVIYKSRDWPLPGGEIEL